MHLKEQGDLMGEKKLYITSHNYDNRFIMKRVYDYMESQKSDRFYYLLPNGELLKKYRREFIDKAEGIFELNLFTFDDVVNNMAKSRFKKSIPSPIKNLILRNSLDTLLKKDALEYYRAFARMDGFVESINEIISEFKRSLVTPYMYLESCWDAPRYREMGLIYEEYERLLTENGLMDRESCYLSSIDILENEPDLFDELDFLVIDKFYDFRPVEIQLIREFIKKDLDIYINMPFGSDENNPILKDTVNILQSMGFEIEHMLNKPENTFEDLADKLCIHDEYKYDFIEDISLSKAPSRFIELKNIFRSIKKKLYEGASLEDMGLCIVSESYTKDLFRVSEEESLPINLELKTKLTGVILVREFINILETILSSGSKENIIKRIKSSYFKICEDEIKNELEYIVYRLKFNNLNELSEIVEKDFNKNIPMEYFNELHELIERLREEYNAFSPNDSVIRYGELLTQLIDRYDVESTITDKYEEIKDFDIFQRDLHALGKLKEIIGQMEEASLIQEEMSFEDYHKALTDFISFERFVEKQADLNGLRILSPVNSNGNTYDILFIAGLSQGEYPILNNDHFFLSDENHMQLKKIGLSYKSYYERYFNESTKFAGLLSSCKSELHMSYCSGNRDKEGIPSVFLDDILSRVSGKTIQDKLVYNELKMDMLINGHIRDASCEKDFTHSLLYKYFNDEPVEEYAVLHERLYQGKLEKINRSIKIEEFRSSGEFDRYGGKLDDEVIIEEIGENLEERVFSVSYLESYARCPYYFLLNNYLNIQEMTRRLEEVSYIDNGIIYHEVLKNYYTRYKDDLINGVQSFNVEDTTDYIRKSIYKYGVASGYNMDNKRDILIMETLFSNLLGFIKEDVDRMNKNSNIHPWEFEAQFGNNNDFFIEKDGERIYLKGTIDRIDKIADRDSYIIMDYKSGTYGVRKYEEMMEGLSLQLPVYIMSQRDKNVVVGAYGMISKGEISYALGIEGEASFMSKRNKGLVDMDTWNQTLENSKDMIFNMTDSIKQGDFSVNPKECSPYCAFKDICRYERVLEVE